MFIGVRPYKSVSNDIKDDILVLDTSDMELEYISVADAVDYGIELYVNDVFPKKKSYVKNPLNMYLAMCERKDAIHWGRLLPEGFDFDRIILDNRVVVITNTYKNGSVYKLTLNGVIICACSRANILYAFRFRNNYVLRLFVNMFDEAVETSIFKYVSVAVDSNSKVIAVWDAYCKNGMNLDFARQVDLISRY